MSVGREGRGKLEDDRPVAGSCQSNYLFVADGDGQHGSTVLSLTPISGRSNCRASRDVS